MKPRYDLSKNWDNLSEQEQYELLQKEAIYNNANELSKKNGFKDINDFVESTDEALNTSARNIKEMNPNMDTNEAIAKVNEIKQNANLRAATLLSELVVKVFKQSLIWPSPLKHLEWVNKVGSKFISEGNGEQVLIDLLNGIDTWDATKYIPDQATEPKVLQDLALFYENNAAGVKTLTQGATQYKDRFSVQEFKWTYALKNGTLSEFIAERITRLRNKYNLYIADNFIRKITSMGRLSANKATSLSNAKLRFPLVEGTANNLFDAMHEVQEILLSMKNADNKYLLGTDEDLKAFAQNANLSNTYILMSEKLYALINSGIKSQVYHNEFWGLANILPKENIIPLGKMWNIPNAYQFGTSGTGTATTLTWTKTTGTINDLAKQSDEKYINENDEWFIIINLDAITNLIFLEQAPSQFFANNLTTEHFINVWLQNYISPVCVGAVYKNSNIYTMPNTLDDTNLLSDEEDTKTKKRGK